MRPFSFSVATFGCKVSQYESQSIREHWASLDGQETDDVTQADVILLASCAVTAEAVSDARQMARKLGRLAPQARIIVTGCAATAEPADFTLPGVIAVVPQQDKTRLLTGHPLDSDLSPEFGPAFSTSKPIGRKPNRTKENLSFPPFRIDAFRRARPVLKVQDGCSHRCSYCIVPLTRGPARSRPADDVVDEARRLLHAGYREIMVSGINLRQYHHDGVNFWALLRILDATLAPEWLGQARFRLSSLEPAQLDTEGLETLEGCRLLCPHLHLSLQSGSPTVLRRMGREHYSPQKVREAVDHLHSFWPFFGLGADILMGFPGESEEETQETLRMVELLPLTYAHVFPWSSRPGTSAADLPGHLPKKWRQEHAARVRALISTKHEVFLREQAALDSFRVALDGDSTYSGVNEYYAPCRLEGSGHELLLCRPVRPMRVDDGKIVCVPLPRHGVTDPLPA